MIIYLLLCNILYIPLILCLNDTASKLSPTKSQSEAKENLPNVPLLSEGGSLMPETLLSALPKEANISDSHHDLIKNKVVARKGVDYADNTTSQEQPPLLTKDVSSMKPSSPPEKLSTSSDHVIKSTDDINVLKGKSTLLSKISDPKTSEAPKIPKKPLILHSDELESMTVKSTMAQSPSKEIYKTNANNHPGMVMPVVITILLVPMFAVFGYMALRRGQEAWKNRHYKRTDFLLDGMYND